MDTLSQLPLKLQTVSGCVRFVLFLVSWPTMIALLNGFLDKDRLAFNCDPKPNDVAKQLCYDRYTSTTSPLFIPLNFVYITTAVSGFLWVVFIVWSAKVLPRIKREENREEKKRQSKTFRRFFLCHILIELVCVIAMMVLFFCYQTIFLPVVYQCYQRNATIQIPINQSQNMTCNDLYYRQKSRLNIGIIVVMALDIFLCIMAMVHAIRKKKDFLNELVDWGSESGTGTESDRLSLHTIMQSMEDNSETSTEEAADLQRPIRPNPVKTRKKGKSSCKTKTGKAEHFTSSPPGNQNLTPRSRVNAAIQTMKDNIKTGTEQPTDLQQPFRPNPGEGPEAKDLKIDQIYVNVVIHEGRMDYDFPTDRWEQLKVYPQQNTNKSTSVRPQDLIDAQRKNVLVVGRPGIGKTIMSTKLLRTWASDDAKMQKEFEVALLLKFRHLNNETHLNLHELLARSETVESLDGEVWKHIIENPTKVLLIFDGIDEFAARSAIANDDSKYKNTVEEKMPVYTLYSKLASGKLLRGATIITTTRPTAVKFIRHLNFDRTIELLGFTSEQVEEYVEKFTEDDHNDDAKETIWQHICSNLNIFSLCYIPVNCFIICHCLLHIINISTDAARKLPSKITDIYSMNIKIFFFKHGNRHEKYSRSTTDLATYIYKTFDDLQPENELVFQRLGEMAFNGIREGRLIFESSEVGELDNCGLLHRLPDVKPRTLSQPPKAQFCFTHLTVQEFFAAKHLTDTLKKEELRRFVAVHIYNGTWQVVMQFVAGLLEPDADREMSNIDIFADLLPMSKKVDGTWISWPANATDRDLALTLCKCLDEFDVKERNSVQRKTAEIGFNAIDFTNCSLTPVDCGAVMHFVKNTKGLEYLNFYNGSIGSLGCRAIRDTLKDVNCELTTLDLSINNIGDQGAAYLCDALKDVNCKLTTLFLIGNNIGEQGAAYLCDALKDANCKLTTLYLSVNNIGEQGAAYLCDALKDVNCKVTTLDLSVNNIYSLRDVNCKVWL